MLENSLNDDSTKLDHGHLLFGRSIVFEQTLRALLVVRGASKVAKRPRSVERESEVTCLPVYLIRLYF